MTALQLLNSVSKIIVFLLVFFSFFLLTVKRKKKISNRLFAVFLLLVAFDISGIFLSDWLEQFPFIEKLRVCSILLQMPVLYFYVLSVCYASFEIKLKHGVHTLLFFVFILLFSAFPHDQKILLLFQIIAEVQYAFYIILSLVALKKYKRIYEENYANPQNLNYKWLVQMIVVLFVAHFFALSKSIIRFTNNENLLLHANMVVIVSALLVTSYFVMKALYQPQLFRGIDPETKPISSYIKEETGETSKQKAAETSPDTLAKIEMLEIFMAEKRPFLDADLTIQKLADQIGFPQKELSSLINHHIGKHFFDFINEYRVRTAMEILKDPSKKEVTVLEILYEVGFNSKSSFNTSFKKYSGLTPVAFRKNTGSTT